MAQLFVKVLYEYRSQSRYQLHEFVLMPEHFHLLITPAVGVTIERAVQFIKGGYSYRVKHDLGMAGEIWQRGFTDRRIRNAKEFAGFRAYILENPVKRGLAETAAEYRYCSACPGFEIDAWLTSAAKAAGV
jgi:putative transposase